MRQIKQIEAITVHGGKALSDAEVANAYMMAGSMFFPVLGAAAAKVLLPNVSSLSFWGALTEATVIAAGTGIGVWVGYQVFYMIYDGEGEA